ncbi:hypothetical protein BDW68DRAFT_191923 [Aspergillus falconensis]
MPERFASAMMFLTKGYSQNLTNVIYIGYVPNGRVLGISKLARITEVYARCLRVQECLTQDVAHAIQNILNPRGVSVIIEASHVCMIMRGVEEMGAVTTTCCMTGVLLQGNAAKQDFYSLLSL